MTARARGDAILSLRADGRPVMGELRKVNASLRALQEQSRKANAEARRLRSTLTGVGSALRGAALQVGGIWALYRALRAVITTVDTLKNLENRMRLVTDSTYELNEAQEQLYLIAQRSRTNLRATSEVYARLALASKHLQISQTDMLRIVETVSKATVLSGANFMEAKAGMIQFSQGMAAGALRGDEFRSVMENIPGLARTIAKGIDVPIGKLREFSISGELTSELIIKGLRRMANEVDTNFETMNKTASQAWTQMTNALSFLVIKLEDTTNFVKNITHYLERITSALDDIQKYQHDKNMITNLLADTSNGDIPLDTIASTPFRDLLESGEAIKKDQEQALEMANNMMSDYTRALQKLDVMIDTATDEEKRVLLTLLFRIEEARRKLTGEINTLQNVEIVKLAPSSDGGDDDAEPNKVKRGRYALWRHRYLYEIEDMQEKYKDLSEVADHLLELEKQRLRVAKAIAGELERQQFGMLGEAFTDENFLPDFQTIVASMESMADVMARVTTESDKLKESVERNKRSWDDISRTIAVNVVDAVRGAQSASEAWSNILNRVLDQLIEALIIQPLVDSISGGLSSLFGGFPGAAEGGVAKRGGYTVVGERGAEIVKLPAGAEVYPHGSVPAEMTRGQQIIVNVNGVQDPTTVENAIQRATERIQRDTVPIVIDAVSRTGVARKALS